MIVTFHLSVYFAYYVWEKYISTLFRTGGNDLNSEGSPHDNNNTSINLPSEVVNETNSELTLASNSMRPDSNRPTGNSPKLDLCQPKNKHNNSDNEDLPTSIQTALKLNEDEGRKTIYDVEPIYECNTGIDLDSKELVNGFKFVPPVYTQRYMKVEHILKQPGWTPSIKKVIDFGCAELTFEKRHLKRLHSIEEIVAVDIDAHELGYSAVKLQPTPTDYLDQRPTPLTVRVFHGSVAHTNPVLSDADAVIAIELIEHLFPPDLDDLPYTVFGFISPKLAVFTTPNADFNVLFPNFSGFRHYDHKFEWSRQQFEDWGNNLVQRYPNYSVEFEGIAPGEPGTQHLGCCSQMAVFVKKHDSPPVPQHEQDVQAGKYELIEEYTYPYFVDTRTRNEKIKDEADHFIYTCVSLSRQFDEEKAKEVPLKSIMQRIKCYNMEKLKTILSSSWEVKTNEKGYEVVIIPDSDEDNDYDSEHEDACSYTGETQDDVVDHCNNPPADDEDWNLDKTDSQLHVNSTIVSDSGTHCVCLPHESVLTDSSCSSSDSQHHIDNTLVSQASAECVGVTQNMDSSCSVLSPSTSLSDNTDPYELKVTKSVSESFVFTPVTSSQSEQSVPDFSVVADEQNKIHTDSLLDTNKDFNCSVYETPYCDFRMKRSDCELYNPSTKSLYHSSLDSHSECSQVLSVESPNVCKELESDNEIFISDPSLKDLCCDSKSSSMLDTSRYATPCYQPPEKKFIPKCLSLQQINVNDGSPALTSDLGSSLSKLNMSDEHNNLSKSMEGFRNQDSCDMHDTCSNASKVVDSGYPDSYSDQYMDMDLTPEQFDDIETESEANDVSSRSASPPLPLLAGPRVIDDVQNGDVVNNNRDGEGNNVVADMEEDEMEFEAQIEEVNNEFLNLAAVDRPAQEIRDEEFFRLQSRESDSESVCKYDSCVPYETESNVCNLERCNSKNVAEPSSYSNEKPEMKSVPSKTKNSVKSSQSCSSIMTNNSSGTKLDCSLKDDSTSGNLQESCTLKKHNSLTTVLNGCSKFSNCSLVQPLDKSEINDIMVDTTKDALHHDTFRNKSPLPAKSLQDRINSFDDIEDCNMSQFSSAYSQQDSVSLFSAYQSVGSESCERIDSDAESTIFPEWLLSISVSDDEEFEEDDSEVWDFDSMEVLVDEPSYNLQIDFGGGGDIV